MNTKKTKIVNTYLLVAIVVVVIINLVFIFSYSPRSVETSLVKKYWGGSTQCVAYVQKYYQDVFDMEITNVGRAQDLYLKAPTYGLFAHRNGGSIAPQPGNILVFEHPNRIGHVAVITGRLNNGVLITEQNWGTSRITTNQNAALPMVVEDGSYSIGEREGYVVLGWVGLALENPTNYFDFESEDSKGWITENKTSNVAPDDVSSWAVTITGKSPSIISPIFIEPMLVSEFPYVVFKAQSYNYANEQAEQGVIHLRDEKDQWGETVTFDVIKSTSRVIYSVDLSDLRDDFGITQMRIELPDYVRNSGNMWEFDWLEISKNSIE